MRMGEAAEVSADGEGSPGAGFVHLRVRSAYSLLEGAIKADKIVGLAKGCDMPAVAIADRANLFGALEFSVATKDAGSSRSSPAPCRSAAWASGRPSAGRARRRWFCWPRTSRAT